MIPGSANALLLATAAPTGYSISRSLRFNSADSAYLSRTPASAGNRKTWTWAGWVKRSKLKYATLFTGYSDSSNNGHFYYYNDTLVFTWEIASAYQEPKTAAVFRDPSAWMHVVLATDTTQATDSNRMKMYVNGVRQTLSGSYPPQNSDGFINSTVQHRIGSTPETAVADFDGYLADIYFIDGQALAPTSFGEFSATTGVWNPKAYTGSYGTNGFHLEFADNSSNTATALGKDTSGNSNNWTPNNLSVTAGSGNDSLVDVPTNGTETDTGVGGEVRGNYATFNSLVTSSTFANGNLDVTGTGANKSTIGLSSGKYYCEYTINSASVSFGPNWGIANGDNSVVGSLRAGSGRSTATNCTVTLSSHSTNITSGTIGIALDMDALECKVYHDNTLKATITAFPAAVYFFYFGGDSGSDSISANFGQRAFAYTAPSGFKALCTANLPAPLVTKPSTVMDVVTYTGTGAALTPTSTLGFNPDLVWIKSRSAATDHAWYDAVRGAEKRVESNTADAQVTSDGGVTAFNSAGFSVGTLAQVNTNNDTYVAWTWDAGSSAAASNNDGSITSTVKANPSAGFSVITGTVPATNTFTIGHGLGAEPHFIIVKVTNQSAYNWDVYHKTLGNTGRLRLNQTNASSTEANVWGSTTPTSSVFTMGGNGTWYFNGDIFVAYCFAPVVGYNSISSYTGNGSSDGVFVFTGMRPRFIMIKRTDTTSNWTIIDTAREGYNVDNDPLYPNLANSEGTTDLADILSNGFKLRSTDASVNASGGTYVFAAFAEAPFNYSRAR